MMEAASLLVKNAPTFLQTSLSTVLSKHKHKHHSHQHVPPVSSMAGVVDSIPLLILAISAAMTATQGGLKYDRSKLNTRVNVSIFLRSAAAALVLYTQLLEGGFQWQLILALAFLTFISAFPGLLNVSLTSLALSFYDWRILSVFFITSTIPRSIRPQDSPEQRASILAVLTSSYTQGYILQAWRNPSTFSLDTSELSSYDRVEELCNNMLPYLDPLSPKRKFQNIGLNFIWAYIWPYAALSVLILVKSAGNFLSPIAIHGLLNTLGKEGGDKTFWIALLFAGPVVSSVGSQLYLTITTRLLTRTQAVLSVLLYRHALRVRGVESGNLINLMSVDLENLINGRDILFVLIYCPAMIIGCAIYLYILLGLSGIAGVSFLVICTPVPAYIARLMTSKQAELMKATDARMEIINENIANLRSTKLFGWESPVSALIKEKREIELACIATVNRYRIFSRVSVILIPTTSFIVMFASYTLLEKKVLTAASIFATLVIVELLIEQLVYLSYEIKAIIQAWVSVNRLNEFFNGKEMLQDLPVERDIIGFHNADFTWGDEDQAESRKFKLSLDNVEFHRNAINLVIGPTGSGKSSLLLALLGEMKFVPRNGAGAASEQGAGGDAGAGSQESFFYLPRVGGVSYAAQEPSLVNATIEANILFGQQMDRERYELVIRECALLPDFAMFEHSDQTEIGERGITLSGGQKARVSLARALYSSAEMVLLDDVFSALDVHTSRHIMSKAFGGQLVKNRTVILVTHHLSLIGSKASLVVNVEGGRCVNAGSFADLLTRNPELVTLENEQHEDAAEEKEATPNAEIDQSKIKAKSGKLVLKEEQQIGRIDRKHQVAYAKLFGGYRFWVFLLMLLSLNQMFSILDVWWLGKWSNSDHGDGSENTIYYLGIYIAISYISILVSVSYTLVYNEGLIHASREMHAKLVQSILSATLRWLDVTPIGRIISRFSQDTGSIDSSLPTYLSAMFEITAGLLFKLLSLVIINAVVIVPGVAVLVIGAFIGEIYIAAQMPVKRQMSAAKAPLYSAFAAAVTGLSTIRAYGSQGRLEIDLKDKAELFIHPAITLYNINRWVGIRIDTLAATFAAAVAAYCVYTAGPTPNAGLIGFVISQAITFASETLWWVRCLNELDVASNSLERCHDYITDIPHESSPDDKRIKPAAAWPYSGSLVVEKLTARYGAEGESPNVLREISFSVRSGEKIGLVGRTGSGKSSLCLALLQAIPTSGSVYFDGVDTKTIELQSLRKQITIIPQEPKLYAGSLRKNLDPWEENDDMLLNSALRSVGLFEQKIKVVKDPVDKADVEGTIDLGDKKGDNKLQTDSRALTSGTAESPEHDAGAATPLSTASTATSESIPITLDSILTTGGANLSQGQRQLIALARAIVRKSKLIISDEATSSLDHETDLSIQKALRVDLHGITLLTIAHRLRTIMDYDRVMVLADGKIIEFDTPAALLGQADSKFAAMVEASGEAELLKSIAHQANEVTN